MNDVLKGVIGSLIAAALIAAGSWLAMTQTTRKTVLHYSVVVKSVDQTTIWYIRLENNSRYAFDRIVFNPPDNGIMLASFDPPCKSQQQGSGKITPWVGQLLAGRFLQALFVFNKSDVAFSSEKLSRLLKAEYQVRDEKDGSLIWKPVPVGEGTTPTLSRGVAAVLWFLCPFAAAGLVTFGGRYLLSRLKRR